MHHIIVSIFYLYPKCCLPRTTHRVRDNRTRLFTFQSHPDHSISILSSHCPNLFFVLSFRQKNIPILLMYVHKKLQTYKQLAWCGVKGFSYLSSYGVPRFSTGFNKPSRLGFWAVQSYTNILTYHVAKKKYIFVGAILKHPYTLSEKRGTLYDC